MVNINQFFGIGEPINQHPQSTYAYHVSGKVLVTL